MGMGIRMGMGIEKSIDREWEWEFGTLIRAGMGIGIGRNIHTIPLTFLTGCATMTAVYSFEKRSPRFHAAMMTSFGRDGDAKACLYATAGTSLHCVCIATLCNKRFLSLGRRFNEAS